MKIVSVDGGATKTFAVYYDTSAEKVLGIGIAGPSNYFSVPVETATLNIKKSIEMATKNSFDDNYDLIIGVAGFGDSPTATKIGMEMAKDIAGKHRFFIENDGVCAYRMSNLFNDGAIFAPGTGSIGIYQVMGKIKRLGGWGWFTGDEGSASWIAKRALTLSEEQYDGLINGDSLIRLVEEYYNVDFIQAINNLEIEHPKRKVALMAPRVSKLAYNGDHIAVNIINEAADYDARILNVMSRFFNYKIPVALVGGTVLAGKVLTNRVKRKILVKDLKLFYGYHVAVGGIVLYLNQNNINFDESLRDKIISQVEKLINAVDKNILIETLGIIR